MKISRSEGCLLPWLLAILSRIAQAIPPPIDLPIVNGTWSSPGIPAAEPQCTDHEKLPSYVARFELAALKRDCSTLQDQLVQSEGAQKPRTFSYNDTSDLRLLQAHTHGRCEWMLFSIDYEPSQRNTTTYQAIADTISRINRGCFISRSDDDAVKGDVDIGTGGYLRIEGVDDLWVLMGETGSTQGGPVPSANTNQEHTPTEPEAFNVGTSTETTDLDGPSPSTSTLTQSPLNASLSNIPWKIHCRTESIRPPNPNDCRETIQYMLRTFSDNPLGKRNWGRHVDPNKGGIIIPASFKYGTCEIHVDDIHDAPPTYDTFNVLYVASRANTLINWCLGEGPPIPRGEKGVGGTAALGMKGLWVALAGSMLEEENPGGVSMANLTLPSSTNSHDQSSSFPAAAEIAADDTLQKRSLPADPAQILNQANEVSNDTNANIPGNNATTSPTLNQNPPTCYPPSSRLTISPIKDDCYLAIGSLITHTRDMYPMQWTSVKPPARGNRAPIYRVHGTCEVTFGARSPMTGRFSMLKVVDLLGEVVDWCTGRAESRGGLLGMGGVLNGWMVQVVGVQPGRNGDLGGVGNDTMGEGDDGGDAHAETAAMDGATPRTDPTSSSTTPSASPSSPNVNPFSNGGEAGLPPHMPPRPILPRRHPPLQLRTPSLPSISTTPLSSLTDTPPLPLNSSSSSSVLLNTPSPPPLLTGELTCFLPSPSSPRAPTLHECYIAISSLLKSIGDLQPSLWTTKPPPLSPPWRSLPLVHQYKSCRVLMGVMGGGGGVGGEGGDTSDGGAADQDQNNPHPAPLEASVSQLKVAYLAAEVVEACVRGRADVKEQIGGRLWFMKREGGGGGGESPERRKGWFVDVYGVPG